MKTCRPGNSLSASCYPANWLSTSAFTSILVILLGLPAKVLAQEPKPVPGPPPDPRVEALKNAVATEVAAQAKLVQEMVDTVFSFGELGFQEFETSRYLTGVLRRNGFAIREGISGIPTAWVATWGSGKPVIAFGSDIDGIPQASQKPGVVFKAPMIEGAPGHGEGHNSGVPLNIAAALAIKRVMEREKLGGTLMLWPGVAEELVAAKAWFVRDGLFKDVDVCLFAHVDSNLGVSWGTAAGNGLVSVEYSFEGQAAHAGAAPWRGRSALDAVELMNVGWNYRREHLRLQQRSHYVVTQGGDQPNVVPARAAVWYYFRETDYAHIKELWDTGNRMADGAALMTDTKWTSRILGTAWPQHFNKTIAEVMQANIQAVGLPAWDEADQSLAKAVQKLAGAEQPKGLASEVEPLGQPVTDEAKRGGGSDDIGDVSWTVPTVTLRYPANISGLPGHSWINAIAMATPIAHKGVVAGAKVQARTALELLLRQDVVKQAWEYFNTVQTKDVKYNPLIAKDTPAAIWLNRTTLEKYRPEMKKHYYDSSKYRTYLEQLGVSYPTLK